MMLDKDTQYLAILEQLKHLVKQFKAKLLLHTLISTFSWLAIFLAIAFYLNLSVSFLFIAFFSVILLIYLLRIKSVRYQQITLKNLLLHLNRNYPQLHESAQLVDQDEKTLSELQKLQKRNVTSQLTRLLADNEQYLLPKLSYTKALFSYVFAALILLIAYFSSTWLPEANIEKTAVNSVLEAEVNLLGSSNKLQLKKHEIIITPPEYTQLVKRQQKELNASFIQGSVIKWQLSFNSQNYNVFIEFSDGKRMFLHHQNNASYVIDKKIDFTGIYRIGAIVDGEEQMLPDIYTLTAIKDNKAKIKIISPKKAITEIATHSAAKISTHVQITDDFKVNRVEILASIAKGSGEAVKFRDQIFLFDSKEVIDGVEHHYKSWQLNDLKMEPGDELYFTVKAWDNRQPIAQMTRSSTKIIRWLEEEQQAVLSDGILIDFMPEYFKSQRQIIIETTELINDKAELNIDKFTATSELLGVAQSELKEKYGQYLGDEVEDGSGSHAISSAANEQVSHISSLDKSLESEHQHDEGGGHVSDDFEMVGFGTDKSGGSELINQFGHNHGDADIGMMARQDPKALMKRSIASMWQAELHLMLSQPSMALPFEQEALKYLKMAKKAERIYVKRLGFEPPPVSEQRRYQGELTDILSYQQHQVVDLSDREFKQLSDLYTWLNTILSKPLTSESHQLSRTKRQLLVRVKIQFENLLETRPTLIKYVATFERILLDNSLELKLCQSCLTDLVEKIWQVLPSVTSKPFAVIKPYSETDILSKKYAEFLSERK